MIAASSSGGVPSYGVTGDNSVAAPSIVIVPFRTSTAAPRGTARILHNTDIATTAAAEVSADVARHRNGIEPRMHERTRNCRRMELLCARACRAVQHVQQERKWQHVAASPPLHPRFYGSAGWLNRAAYQLLVSAPPLIFQPYECFQSLRCIFSRFPRHC